MGSPWKIEESDRISFVTESVKNSTDHLLLSARNGGHRVSWSDFSFTENLSKSKYKKKISKTDFESLEAYKSSNLWFSYGLEIKDLLENPD